MKNCSACGKQISGKVYPKITCQSCYNYYKNGGKDNPLPPKGVIQLDDRGYVICHICGKSYKKLGSHAKESHSLSIKQYKELYGLCANSKTTEKTYSLKMSESAIKNNMPNQLVEKGKKTRFKKGDKTRLGKEVRLQECINKRKN